MFIDARGVPSGTIVEEVVHPAAVPAPQSDLVARELTVSFVENGQLVGDLGLEAARNRVAAG